MHRLIDCKKIARNITDDLKLKVQSISSKIGRPPCLAVVIVGNDPASKIYVRKKREKCRELGIKSVLHDIEDVTEQQLLELIFSLNNDNGVDAILVQLPLPKNINTDKIIQAISPEKDADGFHPVNLGLLLSGIESVIPCTPKGIIRLLEKAEVEISGKEAVVVGRSNIVGKPISSLLLNRDATVTVCHSRTRNLGDKTRNADILIAAVGNPGIIKKDMVKQGAVVIDVGINRENGIIVGDVDPGVQEKTSLLTPVPGGVGPMTIAMLMENVIELVQARIDAGNIE